MKAPLFIRQFLQFIKALFSKKKDKMLDDQTTKGMESDSETETEADKTGELNQTETEADKTGELNQTETGADKTGELNQTNVQKEDLVLPEDILFDDTEKVNHLSELFRYNQRKQPAFEFPKARPPYIEYIQTSKTEKLDKKEGGDYYMPRSENDTVLDKRELVLSKTEGKAQRYELHDVIKSYADYALGCPFIYCDRSVRTNILDWKKVFKLNGYSPPDIKEVSPASVRDKNQLETANLITDKDSIRFANDDTIDSFFFNDRAPRTEQCECILHLNFTLVNGETKRAVVFVRIIPSEAYLIKGFDARISIDAQEDKGSSLNKKDPTDYKELSIDGNLSILAGRCIGRTHIDDHTYCDDHVWVGQDKNTGWNMLVVSDGVGSQPFAARGSRLLCETIQDNFENSKSIAEELAKEQPDPFVLFKDLAEAVDRAFDTEADNSKQVQSRIKLSCTMLIACCKVTESGKLTVHTMNIGDGLIAAIQAKDQKACSLYFLMDDHRGTIKGEDGTFSVGAQRAADFVKDEYIQTKHFKLNEKFKGIFVMSDGVSDPYFNFVTYSAFEKFTKTTRFYREFLANALKVEGNQEQEKQRSSFLKWLNFYQYGNNAFDDRSIAIVTPKF